MNLNDINNDAENKNDILLLVQDRKTEKIIKIKAKEYFSNPSKYTVVDHVEVSNLFKHSIIK